MLCPLKCKKYELLRWENASLLERNQTLQEEIQKSTTTQGWMAELYKLSCKGCTILGVEEKHGTPHVVYMLPADTNARNNMRDIYLSRLPIRNESDYICHMLLRMKPNCTAWIVDWMSYRQNEGFGSMLMKYLISFLRTSGFRSVEGFISWADFDHKEALRGFYTKFGFQITEGVHELNLRLDLLDAKYVPYKECGKLVCCRSQNYDLLKAEVQQRASEKSSNAGQSDTCIPASF